MRALACLVCVLVACGGNAATTDGGVADAGPDAPDAPPVFAACSEFDTSPVGVPAHVSGALSGADLVAPQNCAKVETSFGVESAGPDTVVALRGLTVGQTYVVRLQASADLQFYVVDGCDTSTGPSDSECLLFEDQTTGGEEVGTFVASEASTFVVVDFFASSTPHDSSFTLDVYPQVCVDASACGGATPACVDGLCAQCASSFDCTDADHSVCDDASHDCVAATPNCINDVQGEPDDNGPAGAQPLKTDGSDNPGKICSAGDEVDFWSFDVLDVGEVWTFQLGWLDDSRDLDLVLFDARGNIVGGSLWELPEHAKLTFLAPGRYYATVTEFSPANDAAPFNYDLIATRTSGAGCASNADCAAEFDNQVYRGDCEAGSCVSIDGNGTVAQGGGCDSQSDCGPNLFCPSFFFVEGADTRDVCEPACGSDADCAAGFVCTTYLQTNFCIAKCTDDLQCPTDLGQPPSTPPWFHLSCDVGTGRCLP